MNPTAERRREGISGGTGVKLPSRCLPVHTGRSHCQGLGDPWLEGVGGEAWDQSLTGPRGQRVSVGASPELRAQGTFSRALSEPPSSTIYKGYTGMRGLVE